MLRPVKQLIVPLTARTNLVLLALTKRVAVRLLTVDSSAKIRYVANASSDLSTCVSQSTTPDPFVRVAALQSFAIGVVLESVLQAALQAQDRVVETSRKSLHSRKISLIAYKMDPLSQPSSSPAKLL